MDSAHIFAIIVTYRPKAELLARLESLAGQVAAIIVVHNGGESNISEAIKAWANEAPETRFFIQNEVNNLAVAHNIGLKLALDKGAEWGLLLDEDSAPAPSMLSEMQKVAAMLPDFASVGLVAAHMCEQQSARPTRYFLRRAWRCEWTEVAQSTPYIDEVMIVISSGSLIRLSLLPPIGGMDETFVIDYIDKDFCLRLNQAGYRIVVASGARLAHHIGDSKDFYLGGVRITATNHPPLRRYYIYKNRLRTLGRYGLAYPCFALHELGGMAYDVLRIALYEQQKWQKFQAIFFGLRDALMGINSPRWRL